MPNVRPPKWSNQNVVYISLPTCAFVYLAFISNAKKFPDALFQASAAKKMRTAIFCVITQRVVVIPYRRFGTSYLSRLHLPLKMGPMGVPKRRQSPLIEA